MGTPHKFAFRIAAATLFTAIALAGGAVWLVIHNSLSSAKEELAGVRDAQVEVIARHMDGLRDEATTLASLPETREALKEFSPSYQEWAPERLREMYISNNPYARSKREFLVDAGDGSRYSEVHQTFHPFFQKLRVEGRFEDVYLVTAAGDILYSTGKYRDFATNLLSGPYEDTQLARTFRKAIAEGEAGRVTFSDFEPYEPLFGEHAGFFITLVNDADDSILGAVMVRVSSAPLTYVASASLPSGVEGAIVGPDGRALVSADASLGETFTNSPAEVVSTHEVRQGLLGRRGAGAFTSLAGSPVIGAYGPVPALGGRWASVVEKDRAEIIQDASSSLIPLLFAAIAAALVLLVAVQGSVRFASLGSLPASGTQSGAEGAADAQEMEAMRKVLFALQTKLLAQEQELEESRTYIKALQVFESRTSERALDHASSENTESAEDAGHTEEPGDEALASERAEPNSGSRLISKEAPRRVVEG